MSYERIYKVRKIACHSLSLHIIIACILLLNFLPFVILYGFNPLTLMDLIRFLVDQSVSLDGNHKIQVVKALHKSVQ